MLFPLQGTKRRYNKRKFKKERNKPMKTNTEKMTEAEIREQMEMDYIFMQDTLAKEIEDFMNYYDRGRGFTLYGEDAEYAADLYEKAAKFGLTDMLELYGY